MKTVLPGLKPLSAVVGMILMLTGSALAAPFQLIGGTPKTLTSASLAAVQKSVTQAQVSRPKNSMTFGQKTIRLVAQSGPANDMLSYRIGGLRNPVMVVPKGAMLRVLFVNTDDDMAHNLRFSTRKNPAAPSVGTPNLAHKTETAFHAEEMTLRAPSKPGAYYYLCTVRGHAPGGMWGTLLVR
jgi:rusticyanin